MNRAPTAWLTIDLGSEHALSRWVLKHAGSGGEAENLAGDKTAF